MSAIRKSAKVYSKKSAKKSAKQMSLMLKYLGMIDFTIDKNDNISFPFDTLFEIEEAVEVLVEAEKRIAYNDGVVASEDQIEVTYENGYEDGYAQCMAISEERQLDIEQGNLYGIR